MKILYLDFGMGAAGDMLSGALLGLLPETERADFLRRLNELLPDGVEAAVLPARQCGVTGLHFSVRVHGEEERQDDGHHHHHHHHGHAGLMEIGELVAAMDLDAETREDVLSVYDAIAAAEAEVHGVPVTEIHFHELGSLDAVADITASALLLRALAPERIVASPVAVGSGTVRCAHGILPVPAPATALLLRGIPAYAGEVKGEMCTPTGAALIGRFVASFGPMPAMTVGRIGCGFGTKEFPDRPNCVRAVLGDAFEGSVAKAPEVLELQCELDDMTPEAIGFAMDRICAAGALEVFTVPAGMKKNRPGVLLTALCREEKRESVLGAIFAHTATLGVREAVKRRWELERTVDTVPTVFGPVRRKTARGFGTEKRKWEYEDVARIALERDMTVPAVLRILDADEHAE